MTGLGRADDLDRSDPVSDRADRGIFQGSELPRLLLFLAIAVGGWAFVWNYLQKSEKPDEEPLVVTDAPPPKVEPDRSPEFETVQDKTPLSFRDTAAYSKLLERARAGSAASLAAKARRDVTFRHVWDRPAAYRGVPVHILGTARRIDRYESKLSRTGWLYEAWIFTPEMERRLPYVCVFEDPPKGLPIGATLSERVVFNGYFLKLMRYEASDVPRAAPLLVGRIGWTAPEPGRLGSGWDSTTWLLCGLAVMFAISLYRWMTYLRRALRPRTTSALLTDRPIEHIDAEDLAGWLDTVGEEPPPRGANAEAPPETPALGEPR
ncbi:MAG: hypothetical protein U0835_11510 [Isosphaeraceae bacterium]